MDNLYEGENSNSKYLLNKDIGVSVLVAPHTQVKTAQDCSPPSPIGVFVAVIVVPVCGE